jgi:hypothetical protein
MHHLELSKALELYSLQKQKLRQNATSAEDKKAKMTQNLK